MWKLFSSSDLVEIVRERLAACKKASYSGLIYKSLLPMGIETPSGLGGRFESREGFFERGMSLSDIYTKLGELYQAKRELVSSSGAAYSGAQLSELIEQALKAAFTRFETMLMNKDAQRSEILPDVQKEVEKLPEVSMITRTEGLRDAVISAITHQLRVLGRV